MKTTEQDTWLAQAMPCIMEVQTMLSQQLSDNPAELAHQLTKAESYYSRMNTLLAEASSRLDTAKYAALMGCRGSNLTVDERGIIIANEVTGHKRMKEIINGLCESIRSRLILGMNLRRQNAGERSDW